MPTTHELSVVVCTHNPRRLFLERTLEALRRQQADFARWELVLLDNASPAPLAAEYANRTLHLDKGRLIEQTGQAA